MRRKLNLTGLSDREKDKIHLFEKYDVDRRTREFQEVLGSKDKYITRPIKRNTISRYQIDDYKEETFCRIEKIRSMFKF